jgi:signal peptidase I
MTKPIKTAIHDILELIFISASLIVLSVLFVAEPLEVSGDSMNPTLLDKEQILAEKITTNFSSLSRGDIVIIENPKDNTLIIKRVVGLPGEDFKIVEGEVTINGVAIKEPYLKSQVTEAGKELKPNVNYTISDEHYIVLGDNRKNSSDSRIFGEVASDAIIAKAIMVYKPLDNARLIEN